MTDEITTWRELITKTMQYNNESWDNVVSCTLTDEELNIKFYNGYCGVNGQSFTLWTERRVYFLVVYDGVEWVSSVSRNSDGIPTEHVGRWC